MSYSLEQKRKIILENYSRPDKRVEFEKLKKISADWKTPFLTFRSLDGGCGDVLHLLVIKQGGYLKKCLFSGQQSCLITIVAVNILFSCLEGRDSQFAQKLINNCQKMVEEKDHELDNCPNFQVFSNISQFPHRKECIKLVIRGINNLL